MIDDKAQVDALMRQMEAALPIPAKMTSRLARALRGQGTLARKRSVLIQHIFYHGDAGGISCDITPSRDAKEACIVSLTHLRIPPQHPLAADIRAYQRARNAKLAQQK